MKELVLFFYYLLSLSIAWIQGGFWWIFLNVFFPIAGVYTIAEKLISQ